MSSGERCLLECRAPYGAVVSLIDTVDELRRDDIVPSCQRTLLLLRVSARITHVATKVAPTQAQWSRLPLRRHEPIAAAWGSALLRMPSTHHSATLGRKLPRHPRSEVIVVYHHSMQPAEPAWSVHVEYRKSTKETTVVGHAVDLRYNRHGTTLQGLQ